MKKGKQSRMTKTKKKKSSEGAEAEEGKITHLGIAEIKSPYIHYGETLTQNCNQQTFDRKAQLLFRRLNSLSSQESL